MKPSYIILLALLSVGCTYFRSQPMAQAEEKSIPAFFDSTLISLKTWSTKALVERFYRERKYFMAWFDSTGSTAAADSLIHFIRVSDRLGLIPGDYHLYEINQFLRLPLSHANAVTLDLCLTDAFFSLWHHLKYGRLDAKTLARIDFDVSHEPIASLNKAFKKKLFRAELEEQQPKHEQYISLLKALQLSLAQNSKDTIQIKRRNQLIATLERHRWHRSLPEKSIRINVPSFKLRVVEGDSIMLESKVIIGKPDTPTPELLSMVRSFIIYPYWHVPKSILKEILPDIQQDTAFLKRHNYDVLDTAGKPVKISSVDWQAYDTKTFPYVLRQREGSENTMGVIKFVFRNNYGVYLHDTNVRRLFSKKNRALSHGCVRVHKAVDLARYLVKDNYIVSPEDLDQYMQLQHRMEITLPKPVPVLLQYFTCESVNGNIEYFDDLYKKDQQLLNALSSGLLPS